MVCFVKSTPLIQGHGVFFFFHQLVKRHFEGTAPDKVLSCVSPGCCRRSWRPMLLCMPPPAHSEHTEPYCWPELLLFFGDRRTTTPPPSMCLSMSCPGSKIFSGRQCAQVIVSSIIIACIYLVYTYTIYICPF